MNVRVAIPYSDGTVFPHFGKAAQFKVYDVRDEEVVSSEVLSAAGTGHEEIGLWLVQQGVNAVICGNIGPAAQGILRAAGILALAGVEGSADEAVAQLIAGTLEAVPAATCSHHGAGGCGGCSHGGCSHGGCSHGGCSHGG